MTERTVEAIRSDIERLNAEAARTATSTQSIVQPDAQSVKAAYEDSQLLALSVLVMGVFVLCCVTYLMRRGNQSDTVLRPFATILILVAAVFLVVAGYSEKQIAPVIGLLGTIAGYVLGRNDSQPSKTSSKSESTATT